VPWVVSPPACVLSHQHAIANGQIYIHRANHLLNAFECILCLVCLELSVDGDFVGVGVSSSRLVFHLEDRTHACCEPSASSAPLSCYICFTLAISSNLICLERIASQSSTADGDESSLTIFPRRRPLRDSRTRMFRQVQMQDCVRELLELPELPYSALSCRCWAHCIMPSQPCPVTEADVVHDAQESAVGATRPPRCKSPGVSRTSRSFPGRAEGNVSKQVPAGT
jgi:hypothetical protein